jgi:glycosyltransferase involved in cell wall biosynthesis
MEQLGYANSELAIPHVKPLLRLLKRYPVDLVELETPSPGAWTIGICAKIAGIKVISHYRTDVPSYTRQLVKAKWMHAYVLWLMQVFYRFTRPVVSPCRDYERILVNEIKIPQKDVKILPRGIPVESYHPSKRGKGTWEKFGGNGDKVRFLFVGRISKEKDLPFLNKLWHAFHKKNHMAELMFVGDGWYLDELKKEFADCEEVFFAGIQGGETLAGLYADADFFIFPSGTDTFGNVVVESIASGTPALVTDRGGPQDIIFGRNCGFILPFGEMDTWFEHLERCVKLKLESPEEYETLRKNAYERSKDFTLEHAIKEQWDYFKDLCIRSYHDD